MTSKAKRFAIVCIAALVMLRPGRGYDLDLRHLAANPLLQADLQPSPDLPGPTDIALPLIALVADSGAILAVYRPVGLLLIPAQPPQKPGLILILLAAQPPPGPGASPWKNALRGDGQKSWVYTGGEADLTPITQQGYGDWQVKQTKGIGEYVFPDHLGTPFAWINKHTGTTTYTPYNPWGELLATDPVPGRNPYQTGIIPTEGFELPQDQLYGTIPPIGLTGHLYDHKTGLVYAHHRYLSPRLGHWLTADFRAPDLYDPTTFTEPYSYAQGNPMLFWDPDGLRTEGGWMRSTFATNPGFKPENKPFYQAGARMGATPVGKTFNGAYLSGSKFIAELFYGAALYVQAGLYETTGLEMYREGYDKSEEFMFALFAFLESDNKLKTIATSYKMRFVNIDALLLQGKYEEAGAEAERVFLELYFIIRAAQGTGQAVYQLGKSAPQMARSFTGIFDSTSATAVELGPRINLIAPRPGGINPLSSNPRYWYRPAPRSYQTSAMLARYEGEQFGGVLTPEKVIYLTPDESVRFEVFTNNGKLFDMKGLAIDTSQAFEGKAIFVMDKTGRIFLSTNEQFGVFHHTSLLAGQEVAASGEIIVQNGTILNINNLSGHYAQSPSFILQLLEELKRRGINVPNEFVQTH